MDERKNKEDLIPSFPFRVIERFDYRTQIHDSKNWFTGLIIFFLFFYGISAWALRLFFFKQRSPLLFWGVFVLSLTPFLLNQCILSIVLLLYLILYYTSSFYYGGTKGSGKNERSNTRHNCGVSSERFWIYFLLYSCLYGLMMYCVITFSLYFIGNTTYFDLFHPEYYTSPFLTTDMVRKKFRFRESPPSRFLARAQKGRERVRSKTVVFGILARNIEYNLSNMISKVEGLGRLFRDYRVVLFENDSQDQTRALLRSWQARNSKVVLLDCCIEGSCDCHLSVTHPHKTGMRSQERIAKMRRFRERILQFVQQYFSAFDYYCVMDSDLSGGIYLEGFLSTFSDQYPASWDAVFARGVTTLPFSPDFYLYDGYAFTSRDHEYADSTNDAQEFLLQNQILGKEAVDAEWVACKSGFNGMIIFRMQSILSCSYFHDHAPFRCEHIDLFYSMEQQRRHINIYFNPSLVMIAGQQGKTRLQYLLDYLSLS